MISETRKQVIKDACRERAELEIMKRLAKANNDCEAVLIIDGVRHAFSSSQIFIDCINNEIKEINKALANRTNEWE